MNRIVTRGMGPSRGRPGRAGLITRGYGGILDAIIETALEVGRAIKVGGSKAKRKLYEFRDIVVRAKLMEVNEEYVDSISGVEKAKESNDLVTAKVSMVSVMTKKAKELVKITIKRFK